MVDPANSEELAAMAGEIGAEVLTGPLRYPSETGGWQLGDLDLSEYLDRYRGQQLVLIIAPIGQVEPTTYTCGICGFVMSELGDCPRCRLVVQEQTNESVAAGGNRDVLDQVADFLAGA